MCSGKTCLKLCNLSFITVFCLISIAEILAGTYMLIYMHKINRPETLGQQYIDIPSLTLILFGITLLPLLVLGCCGFCKEVACCVNLYSSILIILSILQILMGVFAIITFKDTNNDIRDQIKEDFTYSFKDYLKDPFVNATQSEMHCCGVWSHSDFGNELPTSCCSNNEVDCTTTSKFLNKHGCVETLTMFIVFWNTIIGYASITIGGLQIIVAILGFCLGCGSFRYYYRV